MVGLDEVGRGSWAGPLMVVAAVVPLDGEMPAVRDSKTLSETRREAIFDEVAAWCAAWAVGQASQYECDLLGMAAAQRLAARRAIDGLPARPEAAIVDGPWNFLGDAVSRVECVVKADTSCASVAAASILAKVTRDRIMRAESEHYPHWHFDTNKGYPCPLHRAALAGHGPSAIHRRSWVFMENFVPWPGLRRPVGSAESEQPALF